MSFYRRIGNGERCHESLVICWLYGACGRGNEHLHMDGAMCDKMPQNTKNEASKLKILHKWGGIEDGKNIIYCRKAESCIRIIEITTFPKFKKAYG